VFPNEGIQKHLVRDTKSRLNSKERMVTGQRVRKNHV